MKNSEYLDFSDHLGHGLTENKRQNLYTFGERTRAAQPGLYRYIIGAAGYTATAVLREEVGASRVETGVMETVLMFARDTTTGTFRKVKDYMNHENTTKKGTWIKTVNRY